MTHPVRAPVSASGIPGWAPRWPLAVCHAASWAVHWVSVHTGLPALVVAAIAIALGYKILKRTARFALEVTVISAALAAATELGWLHW